jgi:tRNA-intron endonuclease
MDFSLEDGTVRAGNRARERFYDSRGYGRPVDGGLELAPVEAAHLLHRGDVATIDGMDFRAFLGSAAVSETAFLVYKDLRDRGFYLSPAREEWVEAPRDVDFVVYPRGQGPWDEAVQYRIRVIGEREDVPAESLGNAVLAVVDEESEITYLETERPDVTGATDYDLPAGIEADLLSDRVVAWDPPTSLYESAFFGQRLDDDGAVQLSLVEAASLARQGVLAISGASGEGADAVVDRGRAVEGDRFDRRLAVYTALRDRGIVPKTGFKFGADFRTYADVESVAELGHSELLVRVLQRAHTFAPRDLALDVRLAHGVRKRMVFALTGANGEIRWLSASRLTP